MTTSGQIDVTKRDIAKMLDTVALVQASLDKLASYDATRAYTANESEPYDALSDRFIRAVEISLRFFRSYERLQFAEESDTLRDRLNRMEKLELISSVEQWFNMRDVRNRIVHDYLPNEIKQMYDDIMGPFAVELKLCTDKARQLKL
ncbi:MAG: nucleotidyltransferase substrate binding protein [bacterium]